MTDNNNQLPGNLAGHLGICHVNVNGLVAKTPTPYISNQKLDEIYQTLALDYGMDIICVSETKLDASIKDSAIKLEGYHAPYRIDRNRHGGGVCIYISE